MVDYYLTIDSYFEYFLTILAWVINNELWALLFDTGLFAAPFFVHIINLFLKVREQGDDEGNKGRLLASWLENTLYLSLFMIVLTCIPVFKVSFSTLEFNQKRMSECGLTVLKPNQTGLLGFSSELNGRNASLPLWWGFTSGVSKGLTHGAIAAIPCKADLRQVRFDVQNTQITDPFLRTEVANFANECFIPTRAKINRWAYSNRGKLDREQANDIEWIGSTIFVHTKGLYDSFFTKTPNAYFPYQESRDSGRASHLGGGFPSCKEWWLGSDNKENGLRTRLLSEIDTGLMNQVSKLFNKLFGKPDGYENDLLRTVLNVQDIIVGNNKVYADYGRLKTDDMTYKGVNFDDVKSIFNYMGTTVGGILVAPVFDTFKQALPMIQSYLVMAIVLSMPLIIVFSGYSIKAVMTASSALFALYFLSFWWELARWMDGSLYEALYLSSTHSLSGAYFFLNEKSDGVLGLVSMTLYLILPTFWFALMSWAGWSLGHGVGQALGQSARDAGNTTKSGSDFVTNKVTK